MKITTNYLGVVNGVPAQVQDIVEETAADGTTFRDALYYVSLAEHDAAVLSGERDAAAQKRVDNWTSAVSAKAADAQVATVATLDAQAAASKDSLRSTVMGLLQQIESL